MMKKIVLTILFQSSLLVLASAQTVDKSKLLMDYFEVYNHHQVEKIIKMVADDFRMYSVMEDTTTLDIVGKENLQRWLTGYFEDLPNVTSEAENIVGNGNFVSFIETAHWGDNRSQSSLAVYEIRSGKIRRVWYYY